MAQVEIYTKSTCPYCMRAKMLLQNKGVTFDEYEISRDAEKRLEMISRANGGSTVPQIFINGQHVGGSDDLSSLERRGKLDPLLAA